jgi:threonine/homoserine/homoserine lactone efflux protein
MGIKLVTGLIGIVLMLAFVSVVALKIRELALVIVILIGAALMVWEFVETLKRKEE